MPEKFLWETSATSKTIKEKSFGWLQWKGTDVCVDIHCKKCGEHTHFDGDFMYYIKCGKCGAIYECNPYIELNEIINEDSLGLPPKVSEVDNLEGWV